jgi:hypothetical protein
VASLAANGAYVRELRLVVVAIDQTVLARKRQQVRAENRL